MPRNQREYLRRFAEECINDLDRALLKIGNIKTTYETGQIPTPEQSPEDIESLKNANPQRYPQYVEGFESIGMIVTQAREFMIDMLEKVM